MSPDPPEPIGHIPSTDPNHTATYWAHLKELFGEAVELESGARRRFLDRACQGDSELRVRLEAMLNADGEASFLRPIGKLERCSERGFVGNDSVSLESTNSQVIETVIDGYRLVQTIGRGGMGEVYLAERSGPEGLRRLAVKVLKSGLESDASKQRFLVEQRALAALDHPNICRFLDTGTLPDARPYLAMEYVEGMRIDSYCDSHRLSVRQRLRLFLEVCSAVSYAHGRLIVHRDLKPANVLVTDDGRVKLLDFGIAKLLEHDEASLTATSGRDRPMTVDYASPEQISGGDTTTATDVYSLGVLLYELLSGHPPFAERTRHELERSVLERSPLLPSQAVTRSIESNGTKRKNTGLTPKSISHSRSDHPRGLRRSLRGDLDTVVTRALCKEPEQRFASVDRFAADVSRYLRGHPIHSRRPTLAYRTSKLVLRNKLASASISVVAITLVASALHTARQAAESGRARDAALLSEEAARTALVRAEHERSIAEEVTRFLEDLLQSPTPGEGGRDITVLAVLAGAEKRIEQGLSGSPRVRAAVHKTLARTLLALGELRRAQRHADSALALGEIEGDERDLVEALLLQGSTRYARGEITGAESALRRAEGIVFVDPSLRATVLNNLGAVQRLKGDVEEAERLFRRALELRIETSGPESLEAAECWNNLSGAVRLQGRTEEAEAHMQRSLRIRRQYLAQDHPLVTQSVSNLAVLYAAQGRFAEAEPLLRESIESSRKVLGPDHPDLAADLSNLASTLEDLGRHEDAASAWLECFEIRKRAADNPALISITQMYYGRALLKCGRLVDAEVLLLDVVPMISGFSSEGHDYYLILLETLRSLYIILGDDEQAASYGAEIDRRNAARVDTQAPNSNEARRIEPSDR